MKPCNAQFAFSGSACPIGHISWMDGSLFISSWAMLEKTMSGCHGNSGLVECQLSINNKANLANYSTDACRHQT